MDRVCPIRLALQCFPRPPPPPRPPPGRSRPDPNWTVPPAPPRSVGLACAECYAALGCPRPPPGTVLGDVGHAPPRRVPGPVLVRLSPVRFRKSTLPRLLRKPGCCFPLIPVCFS